MKKTIIFTTFLIFTFNLFSQTTGGTYRSIAWVQGGITPHFQMPQAENAVPLCNDMGGGVIYNETHTLRMTEGDWSSSVMIGENSYCRPIWGLMESYNLHRSERIEVNGTLGFYHFDEEGFDFSEGAFFSQIGDFYFVPIAAVEVNFTIAKFDDFEVKITNLVTPVITNHGFAVQMAF